MLYESIELLKKIAKGIYRHIILISILLFIIVTGVIWINYKIITIKVTGSTQDAVVIGYRTSLSLTDQQPQNLKIGTQIVHRDLAYFESSSRQGASIIAESTLPLHEIHQKITINLQPEKQGEKVHTSPHNCISDVEGELYSYNCTTPKNVLSYQTDTASEWGNPLVDKINIEGLGNVQPYRNGLIGIWRPISGVVGPASIAYVDIKKQEQKTITLPASLAANSAAIGSIYTDTVTHDGKIIITLRDSGNILVVDIDNINKSQKIPLPEKHYNKNDTIMCSLARQVAACYAGKVSAYNENPTAHKDHTFTKKSSYIYKISLNDSSIKQSQTLRSDVFVTSVHHLPNDRTYISTSEGHLFESHQDKLRLIARKTSAVQSASRLYFTLNDTLYTLTEDGSLSRALLGISKSLSFSNLSIIKDTPYIASLNNKSATTKYSRENYFFTPSDNTAINAKILSLVEKDYIHRIDYQNEKINVTLNIPVISDKAAGKTIIDQKEKQDLIDKVERDITQLLSQEIRSKLTIIYNP